jgi:hypothetical protein
MTDEQRYEIHAALDMLMRRTKTNLPAYPGEHGNALDVYRRADVARAGRLPHCSEDGER